MGGGLEFSRSKTQDYTENLKQSDGKGISKLVFSAQRSDKIRHGGGVWSQDLIIRVIPEGSRSQLLQTTNSLIARPLSGSPNCAWY